MALNVYTLQPTELLEAIRREIVEEHIRTWVCDGDGDFTHARAQWQKRAWLRPHILNDRLRFTIFAPVERPISVEVYAVYHGRFIEMLLAHFDHRFERVTASAFPEIDDDVGS